MAKIYDIEIKWGLGSYLPRSRQRIKVPIKLYHVVKDGRTLASFVNESDAEKWVADYKQRNPQSTHDKS